MNKITLLFLVSFSFLSFSLKNEDLSLRLNEVMQKQADAWNRGDLEGYMKGYWNSDSLVFTGGTSLSYGYKTTLNRYRKSYDSREKMGQLIFDEVTHHQTAETSAFSTGKWTLQRQSDTLSGRFTLVWQVKNGEWKIIADHSS